MKVIILGGYGFIGKSVQRLLLKNGYEIFPLSRRSGLDLLDYNLTVKVFSKINPDIIINCATNVGSVHYVTQNAADVLSDNAIMILNIYNAVKNISKNIKIINPIANCGYPASKNKLVEKDFFNGDIHPSVYGYGHTRRLLVSTSKVFYQQYDIVSSNIVIPNAYGPGDSTDPNKTHALNGMVIRMINSIKNKQNEFIIWGTGEPIREWAYVEDVSRVLIELIDNDSLLIDPINFAQGKGFSIKETAEIISKACNFTGKIKFDLSFQDGSKIKIMDSKLFNDAFPAFKFFNFEKGIINVIKYYKKELKFEQK